MKTVHPMKIKLHVMNLDFFPCMIIKQLQNVTNTVKRRTPAKQVTDLHNSHYGHMAGMPPNWSSQISCELSPIEIVSKIMKLCDYYVAKNSHLFSIIWIFI